MDVLHTKYLPLELVLNVIVCSLPKPNVLLAPGHPITQLLLAFTLVCHETRRVADIHLRQHCVYLSSATRLSCFLLTIPQRPELCKVSALFLSPFGETIDDLPTATWVRELFGFTAATLKRLVIDIPLRSLYTENDHLNVRRILREAFRLLEHLEEFVSVRDELYLDDGFNGEEHFWTIWPKLRHLAVYNPDVGPGFWRAIGKMQKLETIVVTRADGLRDHNMKAEYLRHSKRSLKVLLVNVDLDQMRFGNLRRINWDALDPERKMTIMTYNIPLFCDDDAIEVCQDYVRIGAEYGTLWDWEGEIIQHPPRFVQQVSSGA